MTRGGAIFAAGGRRAILHGACGRSGARGGPASGPRTLSEKAGPFAAHCPCGSRSAGAAARRARRQAAS